MAKIAGDVTLTGIKEVMKNLNEEVEKIKNHSLGGLIEAAMIVRTRTENSAPLTPLDLGNLRASWFTVTARGPSSIKGKRTGEFTGKRAGELSERHATTISAASSQAASVKHPVVIFGYTANYAIYVHENLDAMFQRPGSGPRWFQTALEESQKEILQAIEKSVKIKK